MTSQNWKEMASSGILTNCKSVDLMSVMIGAGISAGLAVIALKYGDKVKLLISNQVFDEKKKLDQTTNSVLMVPPCAKSTWNQETAQDNKFMHFDNNVGIEAIVSEWKLVLKLLKDNGINVITPDLDGFNKFDTPDCLFPNNWFSTSQSRNSMVIYPMKAESRRREVRKDIIDQISKYYNDKNSNVQIKDLREMGFKRNEFLEGTGALVLDHENLIAYCSLSQRCDAKMALNWCNQFGYKPVLFESYLLHNSNTNTKSSEENKKTAIYHTNVMMSVGSSYVIAGLECIEGEISKKIVKDSIIKSGKELIEITNEQVLSFCGNVIELKLGNNKKGLFMSEKARNAFRQDQIDKLQNKHKLKICSADIDHIETVTGGGVRCMICELFDI